jgi:hypothetical protein
VQQPLKGLRIAATIPPSTWFGGVDYAFAMDMQHELTLLGAQVCALPVEPFVRGKEVQILDGVSALQSFRPDVAVSLANAGYPLLCNTMDGKNVFRDVLQIPTVMLWDHGPLQFSRTLLGKPPVIPSESSRGCIGRLREALDHPLFTHYSPDRGHIAAFDEMGILAADKVCFFLQPAYPSYVRHGYKASARPAVKQQITFAGNVYIEGSRKLSFGGNAVLGEIQARVFAAKKDRFTTPLWDLLLAEIGNLDRSVVERLQLDPDASFFWSFAHDVIEIAGNTEVRLDMLTNVKSGLQFYGNFVEPDARSVLRRKYGIQCRDSLHCVTELPRLYAGSAIVVDVVNSGYNTGSSPKVTAVLAAGGLPLFDYKPDFHESMGDAGKQVMYHSIDQLNSLIDHYMTNPALRLEVIRELQERVRERFTFGTLMTRILADEPRWRQC